jgi:adenosylhomocysteine nucleosidase
MSEIKPCHTAVLFALAAESGGFEDLLSGLVTIRGQGFTAKEGGCKGRRVVVVRSEPGQTNAAAAAETVIDGHHPRWLISAGFAGGLDPSFTKNDLLLADRVGNENGQSLPLSLDFLPSPFGRGAGGEGEEVRVGDGETPKLFHAAGATIGQLLTLDRIVRTPEEKKMLFEKHSAAAADMETFAVAEVCRRRNVPMLGVRIILDAAADALPPDIERLLRQPSELARWGAALRTLWRRPRSIKDLWTLKERALIASDKLAKFLADLIATLSVE